MPRFSTPRPLRSTKILYLGHTGSGKTGSLCSLAAAGYNVRILDLDAGTELIDDFVGNVEKSIYRKAREGLWTKEQADSIASRMSYVTITETYRKIGPKMVARGDAWQKILNFLDKWEDGEDKPGGLANWAPEDILVIDGLSRLCEAAMNFQLAMNGRAATGPQVGTSGTNDYTATNIIMTNFLDSLKATDVRCNVVVICHIMPQEIGEGTSRETIGFPQTVGRILGPRVGQYFNHAIEARQRGTQRVILTNTSDQVRLKNVAPLRVKASYPLETGLAEYFRDIRATSYATAAGASEESPAAGEKK